VLVIVAGCATPAGLTIEVVAGGDAVARVELILGSTCESCPSLMGAPALAPRHTTIHESLQTVAWRADRDGELARFHLSVDGSDAKIPLLVAIGFDGNGTAIASATLDDVIVPAHDTAWWRMPLAPLVPISDSGSAPDGSERVAVWRHPEQTEPSCVMVERWTSGTATTSAVVPAADPDCDRVVAQAECAAYVPDAMDVPPTLDDASCWLKSQTTDGLVCLLGGTPCTDGEPASTTCQRVAETYCMPDRLCACEPGDIGCLFNALTQGTSDGSMPTISCTVPITDTGELCAGPTVATIDASIYLGAGVACNALRISSSFSETEQSLTELVIATTGKLAIENFRAPCSIDLRWSGTVANPSGTYTRVDFAQLDLDNDNSVVVPLRVDVVKSCTQSLSCETRRGASTTESLYLCTK
jgi:hypothetical protein